MTFDDLLARSFSFFFKYRPVVFEKGRLAFEAGRLEWIAVAILTAVSIWTIVSGLRRQRRGERRRLPLLALRCFALLLIAVALLRPVMRAATVIPGENFLAVLIDDSRSMRLPAAEGSERSRGAAALDTVVSEASELRQLLGERFTLRYYRFANDAERLDPAVPPGFDGRVTDLATALDQARRDLAGVPLAGAVVLSDGADNAATSGGDGQTGLAEVLLQYKSRALPIYAVGLGEERFRRDLELAALEGPRRVLVDSAFAVDVRLRQQGFGGESARLTVERRDAGIGGGTLVDTREVELERGSDSQFVRLTLEAEEAGPQIFRVLVEATADGTAEAVTQNNVREILVMVEKRREKILYVEGEPRWEVKFLRRAIADDEALQLVVLQRAADNKFLRLGVEDSLELVAGFPKTREELFAYRGVILGSVEADFFTDSERRILEEFVGERGGGVLFLGGRHNFNAGGWATSDLAGVFPVVLDGADAEDAGPGASRTVPVKVSPTSAGREHVALRLADTAEASAERWATLPPLTVRQRLTSLKPGAVELLAGKIDDGTPDGGGEVVVLASQRYGAGRALALTVQDSWLWQMHADIPPEDETHERLWRQLLRFLTGAAPRRVELETRPNRVASGEPLELVAAVRDAGFLGLNNARVTATLIDPLGGEHVVPLEWIVEKDGEYRAFFVPEHEGYYEARLAAEAGGERVGADEGSFVAADLGREYFAAELNADLLRRIARESGGRFYTAQNAAGLAEDARFTRSGRTVTVSHDLWDMPVVLMLLLAALGAEWVVRRHSGLA